jgi:hypothetical protein
MSGLVGAPAHLAEQIFPFVTGKAAAVKIGARPFATMIEKTDVIVLALERLDFFFDKSVELAEISFDVDRNCKVHSSFSSNDQVMREA